MMRTLRKDRIFPVVNFSRHVKKSLRQLDSSCHQYVTQEYKLRLQQIIDRFDLDNVATVGDVKSVISFETPFNFLSMEKQSSVKAALSGFAYFDLVSSLLLSFPDSFFESKYLFSYTRGVDPFLQIAFPEDMPCCSYFVLQEDRKFVQQFSKQLVHNNNSILFLYEKRGTVIRNLGVGKFSDIFAVEANNFHLLEDDDPEWESALFRKRLKKTGTQYSKY